PDLKIPHMGWSSIEMENACPLAKDIKAGDMLYFVHSFKAVTEKEYLSLYCEYGGLVPGLVFRGNVFGAQFHPEKSGAVGLKILKNFGEL
ncbi:MAG: imidazole glycerol phosphate synthase subunit HisH, partial [Firmicutes bacterium]|nr:imidazole glycerol phosphate synthase subunit HisH [Bacillota bacterium]